MLTLEQATEVICRCDVLPDIGQLDVPTKRKLAKWVKAGTVVKWRGYWFPIAGAPVGMGPLKTCYGIPPAYEAAKQAGPAAIAEWQRMAAMDKAMAEARASRK